MGYEKTQYCPNCGNTWTYMPHSFLFQEHFYCQHEDKIYVLSVEERNQEWFNRNYNTDRRQSLVNAAKVKEAKKKVTKQNLIDLGLLE